MKNQALFYILFLLSELLPVIFYVSFLKRNRHEGLQVIFVYCLVSLLTEIFFPFLKHSINEFYLYTSFTIFEYTLLTTFLYISIQGKLKYVPVVGTLAFYAIAISNLLNNKSAAFDSLPASFEAILIIIYSLLFLYGQIKDPTIFFVYYTKKFWVVIAVFLYFSSTLFLFLYAATFTTKEHKLYWIINNLFEIIKNILFCVAFIMKKNKPSKYPLDPMETLSL